MHRYKRGKAKSGPGGKGGKVESRKQAIAIGLWKAPKEGQESAEEEVVGGHSRRFFRKRRGCAWAKSLHVKQIRRRDLARQ